MTIVDDIRDLLPLYATGVLDAAERQVVDRAVATDPALAAELAAQELSASQLILPEVPSPEVKARLLASAGGGPFDSHASRMAAMLDISLDRARELLGLVERKASWEPQIPGISLVHFVGGPAYLEADCGFIRIGVGATFPPHTHMGEELSLVLSGRMRDGVTGRVYGPGDELLQSISTTHHLTCEGDEPCVYVARAMNGITVMGTPVRPHRG